MNAHFIESLIESTRGPDSAFGHSLAHTQIAVRTPAALAEQPDPRTSSTYTFLSTAGVIRALEAAGFVPVAAAQTQSRRTNPLSARHVIRFRRRYETISLRDCIPEILFLNAHDGRSALQFRIGLYRAICTNGLIVWDDSLPIWKVPHRGSSLDEVIAAAIRQSEQFSEVGAMVERMERTHLEPEQRFAFAVQALRLRFPTKRPEGLEPADVLVAQREEDGGHDLWTTYNVIQEHVIKGGLRYRTGSNRAMRSRGIRAIREDVRLNTELWKMATALAA